MSLAAAAPGDILARRADGAFPLIVRGKPATIYLEPGADAGVLRAARALQADLAALAGRAGRLDTEYSPAGARAVIVGVIGQSAVIDQLVASGKIDLSDIEGLWEGFAQIVVDDPLPGLDQALVIVGADKRGTIFGIYDLLDRAGVSPWSWWADVPIPQKKDLWVAAGRRTDKPAVRYRGIFLNDENPALYGWANETFGGFNHTFYEKVFELILRLKGNYLWPAMWGKAFYDDDPENAVVADEMGVVIGTSHHEPLMRAHVEWERYGKGAWDYAQNAEFLKEFWRKGLERKGVHEGVVTIGMRGDGDEAMSEDTAIGLLERIVADQRAIIADVTGRPAAETAQVWALYKEVQDYYDQGMKVPDDVTLLFADDNWGNIRRLPATGPARAGGYGVYYHFDYVGGPRNYKWLNTTQIERVWEQMRLADVYGAKEMWIVNVGDLKPMEFPITFFLDFAWNPADWPLERLSDYPRLFAREQFGNEHAAEIGDILSTYTKYNARRKPELIEPDTYSLVNFGEWDRVVADYDALAERAEAMRRRLPAAYDDAYRELVWFPIMASANLNALYAAAAKNRLYAEQGRAEANVWAEKVQTLFANDAALTRFYHEDIAGGKWNHMMSQTHIGYTGWQQPDENIMPEIVRIKTESASSLGVALAGVREAFATGERSPTATIDRYAPAPTLEAAVFTRGPGAVAFKVSAPDFLRVTPAAGTAAPTAPVSIAVDWALTPAGESITTIEIADNAGGAVTVPVRLVNRTVEADGHVFVAANGYAAIEATRARRIDGGDVQWREIPNLGRTGSSVAAFPVTAPVQSQGAPDGPRLEYDVHLSKAGPVAVDVVLAPTLDFKGAGGLRYGVSIDDQPPVIIAVTAEPTGGAWAKSVRDYAHTRLSQHHIDAPGVHTVKIWMVDAALVFQRVTVMTEAPPETYLGAPEARTVAEVE